MFGIRQKAKQSSLSSRAISKSVIFFTSALLALTIIVTAFSISTLAVSFYDAQSVNTSGSLRMLSYRLAFQLQQQAEFTEVVQAFDNKLRQIEAYLNTALFSSALRAQLETITMQWQQLKPLLFAEDPTLFFTELDLFVLRIDSFVFSLQNYAERKLWWLFLLSGAGLSLIILLLIGLLHYTRQRIVSPLNKLVESIHHKKREAKNKTLNNSKQCDELELLANHLAQITNELNQSDNTLFARHHQKLQSANQSIAVLYCCSKELSADNIGKAQFTRMLESIVSMDSIAATRLRMQHPELENWTLTIGKSNSSIWQTIPLTFDGMHFGQFQWQVEQSSDRNAFISTDNIASGENLAPIDILLPDFLVKIAVLFSRAMHGMLAEKKALHLAVTNERKALGRELHDSVAQSLCYLKIKSHLLTKQLNQQQESAQEIASDIELQLDEAYQQLRTLLTEFRLPTTKDDFTFACALEDMLALLNAQSYIPISLINSAPLLSLNPLQQHHLLLIIKEACTNAIKHSQAKEITVRCKQENNGVLFSIEDDGVGFAQDTFSSERHGLAIMHERANLFAGELHVISTPDSGCTVRLFLAA